MADLNNLSVTDVSDLRTEAGNFEQHATDLKTLTDSMFQLVDDTSSFWEGAARDKFVTQFNGLQDEMEYLYKMVDEYHTDLIEIADNYEAAESENESEASQLETDVELV